ncbi:hypothetical protein POM88_040093 [Heracleum sosnowskyi]|uniref:F-box domain-containing protein n=1 Tax=Heracleum sosnowskyi TaxID=360622 RepID=A0AAD8M9H2_9APIA|nr:hypothetical protein POM88_040093 [Heracleum sosnowskyi]
MNPATRRSMSSNSRRRRTLTNNDSRRRPWASLLPDLLIPLLMRLGIIDLCACAAVCKEWRSIIIERRSTFLQNQQPLAIVELKYEKNICLHDLFGGPTYKTLLPNLNLQWLVGVCCGYLIMLVDTKIWLLNLITGNEIHFPMLPFYKSFEIRAILFYSEELSENLLLVFNKKFPYVFLSLSSKPEWHRVEPVGSFENLVDIAYFNGNIHILTSDARIGTLKLEYQTLEQQNVRFSFVRIDIQNSLLFPLNLVPAHDQLYMLSYLQKEREKVIMIHRLNERLMEWEKVKDLGENALFVSEGSCAVVNPTMWGGRSNCIYFLSKACKQYRGYTTISSQSSCDGIAFELEEEGSLFHFWYFPHQVDHKNIVP